jgi:hypothetical protein
LEGLRHPPCGAGRPGTVDRARQLGHRRGGNERQGAVGAGQSPRARPGGAVRRGTTGARQAGGRAALQRLVPARADLCPLWACPSGAHGLGAGRALPPVPQAPHCCGLCTLRGGQARGRARAGGRGIMRCLRTPAQKSPGALTGTSPRRGNFAGQEGFRDCVPSGALPRPRCAHHPCAEVAQVSSRSRSWVSRRSPPGGQAGPEGQLFPGKPATPTVLGP